MAKTKTKRVAVLSPDGFEIEFGTSSYKDMDTAVAAFKNWAKRFEFQGYYSSNRGRIPLTELHEYCGFVEI